MTDVPNIIAYSSGTNGGAVATVTPTNPTGANAGDIIVVMISDAGVPTAVSNANGWNLFKSQEAFNTRHWTVAWIDWQTTLPTITVNASGGLHWLAVAIRPDANYTLDTPVVGTSWRRVDNGGSINTTQATTMNCVANSLALALFSETSTTAEVESGALLTGTGWTKGIWTKPGGGNSDPINFIAYKDMAAGGASGNPTVTYLTTSGGSAVNSNNGIGVQVIVSQTRPGIISSVRTAARRAANW